MNTSSTKMSHGNKDNKAPPSQSIAKKLDEAAEKIESLFSSACIYRVPEHLRKLKESAYTPHLITIGPLHQGNEQLGKDLQMMRDVKMYYTKYLLSHLVNEEMDKEHQGKIIADVLKKCEGKMKTKECVDKAKKYYAEHVTVEENEMGEMMLVDGCFILELLYSSHLDKKSNEEDKSTTKEGDGGNTKVEKARDRWDKWNDKEEEKPFLVSISSFPPPTKAGEGGSSSVPPPTIAEEGGSGGLQERDPILGNILNAAAVKHDLLLLENQIPFFVLEDLFNLTVAEIRDVQGKKNKVSLAEYVVSYFQDIMNPKGENSGSEKKTCCSPSDCILSVCGSSKKKEAEANHYDHILHLLHDYYGPYKTPGKNFSEFEVCASDLDHAGVKFEPFEGNNIFDVDFNDCGRLGWFHGATFKIPTLHIQGTTEPLLRNLIALEQCCPRVSPNFTSFAKLMDMLINSEEDVQVLKKAKVIHNYLGKDKDVADLFNNLCNEIVLGKFKFFDECQKASDYSNRSWPQFRGKLIGTYFASTWSFLGFCAICIAFVIEITNFVLNFLK